MNRIYIYNYIESDEVGGKIYSASEQKRVPIGQDMTSMYPGGALESPGKLPKRFNAWIIPLDNILQFHPIPHSSSYTYMLHIQNLHPMSFNSSI